MVSNQGKEIVTIQVLDQGFSGADPTGEFDGTNALSTLAFEVNIIPVNNIPFITVPRPSDPIVVQQNMVTQLSAVAEEPGLSIIDVDSDECGGILEMKVEVSGADPIWRFRMISFSRLCSLDTGQVWASLRIIRCTTGIHCSC